MTRNLCGGALVLALAGGEFGTAAGQETGTPIFSAPTREFTNHEFGASLSDPGEGADVAIEGFYRFARGPFDFGLRAGIVDFEGSAGTGEVVLGGDFRTQLIHASESFPLDGTVTLGPSFTPRSSRSSAPRAATMSNSPLVSAWTSSSARSGRCARADRSATSRAPGSALRI